MFPGWPLAKTQGVNIKCREAVIVDTREVEALDLCFGDERVAEAYEEAARHCEAFPENVYTLS